MRKPRNYDAELKALSDKVRDLKEKKVRQFGELVIATGADALDIETLAGGLLAMVAEPGRKEAMRQRGAAFFRGGAEAGAASAPDARGARQGGGHATAGGTGPRAS